MLSQIFIFWCWVECTTSQQEPGTKAVNIQCKQKKLRQVKPNRANDDLHIGAVKQRETHHIWLKLRETFEKAVISCTCI